MRHSSERPGASAVDSRAASQRLPPEKVVGGNWSARRSALERKYRNADRVQGW